MLASALACKVYSFDPGSEPWPPNDLLQPEELAKRLKATSNPPLHIFCVTFPTLYRQKHIPQAVLAGPTNKPEGLEALRKTASSLDKNSEIVLYCGCCPMDKCPNVRPAYRTLKEQGFTKVRVLNLPTNFHTDWVAKNYPVV